MRSTKASAAVERLKRRSDNVHYSMTLSSNGLFCLMLPNETGISKQGLFRRLCEPMPIDEFVAFVNSYQPLAPKRVSKLDVAFQEQLAKK